MERISYFPPERKELYSAQSPIKLFMTYGTTKLFFSTEASFH